MLPQYISKPRTPPQSNPKRSTTAVLVRSRSTHDTSRSGAGGEAKGNAVTGICHENNVIKQVTINSYNTALRKTVVASMGLNKN
jgi:hypothetical protein